MTAPLSTLYNALHAVYDLEVETVAATDLQTLCRTAVADAPSGERDWRAHQLRRRVIHAYRHAGYVMWDGRFFIASLLDVIGALWRAGATR